MLIALFGLFLAAGLTVVVGDDYDNDSPNSPPDSYDPHSWPYPPASSSRSGSAKGFSAPGYQQPSSGGHVAMVSGKSYAGDSGDGDSSGDHYASQGGLPLGTFNTADNRQQWGEYDINTDYNFIVPDTGVIREVCHQTH